MKRLVVHIGQHKTGSKALQAFCFHNRARLAQHGLLYPQGHPPGHPVFAYQISHYKLYQGLLQADDQGLQSWFQQLAAQPQPTVLLSAEDVFEMLSAHRLNFSLARVEQAAARLHSLATSAGFQPQVVVYLRRQDQSLASHYSQYLRGGGDPRLSFHDFQRATHWRFDPRPTLRAWASVFSHEAFCLREYPQGGVVHDFFGAILEARMLHGCHRPPPSFETTNPSSDRDTLELIRLAHRYRLGGLRDALVASAPPQATPASIRSWLNPAQLRQLHSACHPINLDIARTYALAWSPDPPLDQDWLPYPGLSLATLVRRLLRLVAYRLRLFRSSAQRGAQAAIE